MIKLINISTYDTDLKRFQYDKEKISDFIYENNMQGIELLNPRGWDEKVIDKELIKGVHLSYYPNWIDFWKGDKKALFTQFENEEEIKNYYGGLDPKVLIKKYREEIKCADKIGAKYVVFHVSQVYLKETFTYKFCISNREVIKYTIEFVNEIFKELDTNITILFENLWWPGLTFLDKGETKNFIEGIEYENKGFVLDTGHLLNGNPYVKNEEDGIEYILKTVSNLGELKDYIKLIHLNLSLSGESTLNKIKKYRNEELTLKTMKEEIWNHIISIDLHKPFTSKNVQKIINLIKPIYVTYEFITRSNEEHRRYIETQNKALEK
ncbi:xylose isomerase [Clostridiaceae bacterium 14S0207]|nr:xylose isomerase [Clostridiaceae bacterium 14S0207]